VITDFSSIVVEQKSLNIYNISIRILNIKFVCFISVNF